MEEEKKKTENLWTGHFINDEVTFKAVNFALFLLKDGKNMDDAIGISSHHYKLAYSAVATEIMANKFVKKYDATSLDRM